MERINLARYPNRQQAQSAPATLPMNDKPTVVARAHDARSQHARQILSVIWIFIAWMIGTLVSELNAIGADPERPLAIPGESVAHESMMQKWTIRETEFAISLSGIADFDRVQRNSLLRSQCDSIIQELTIQESTIQESTAGVANVAAEPVSATAQNVSRQQAYRTNPSTANDAAPAAKAETQSAAAGKNVAKTTVVADTTVARKAVAGKDQPAQTSSPPVELAFQKLDQDKSASEKPEASAQLAWRGFSEGSIPGIVELVVHSFHELMTPVHVQPLAADQAVVNVADSASDIESSVSFVESDAQESPPAAKSLDLVVVQPPSVDRSHQPPAQEIMEPESDVAEHDQDRREEVATEVRVANTIPAQIVRSRPQLLRVPEHSGMLPARALDRATHQSTVLGQSEGETAKSIVAQTFPEPIQPGTRLAAKWPFERSQPVNPTTGVTLNIDNADVRTVFEMLARGYQMNILVAPDVEGSVTANVEGLSPDQTLQGIVKMCGLNMQQDEDIIYIYAADQIPNDARQLRVFELDYARAVTLEPTIQGLLSPVGNAYPTTLSETDNMQTQESIVVVDIPSVILQVERYIMQADQAPRQVMIEAHVLEVELKDDMVHGVNFAAILGGDLTVGSFGLADNIVSKANPVFFAQIDGSDVNALLTVLETTTDSKTLASPRVQVINGQNARIQVGQQLGFTVATVTQTSTIQDVQFLETGVVLTVTPNISRDGRILMQVKPEVSDGVINPDTLLPEEETREVETSVLLDNHQGVIIGGLIQEKDRTVIKKLPWLGDVQYVGKLFQRREAVRSRTEIIVALVPHIIERCVQDERSAIDYERAATPLLQGALHRNCRPWDARLPDVVGDDCIKEPIRINHILPDVKH